MTTQALSNGRAFWNGAYYLGELRRSWANALLYTLVYFFGMNLPLLSMVNDYRYRDFSSLINHGLDYYLSFEGYSIVAMLIAVWAAIAAMSYLHKRVSAYHYHSMPIRREGVLLVKTVVAFTDYLIALIPNFALAGFLYMMLPHHTGISSVLTLFGCSLLAFAVTFAFTMLIGTLTGTRSFHFLLTGIAGFVVPAWIQSIYAIADRVVRFLRVDYLISYRGPLTYSSPFFYFILQMEQCDDAGLSWTAVLVLILFTLACFAGALVLIRIRPTEGAETPVVFNPVAAVVKYAVMVPATILLGYFFGEVFSWDGVWSIFGMISGAVLSFMLMNVLLTRNARQMFRGWVGLLIFVVVIAGASFGVASWYHYHDTHTYTADQVVSVNVSEYSKLERGFTLSDPETVKLTSEFLARYFALATDKSISRSDGIANVSTEFEGNIGRGGLSSRRIFVSQTTSFGITHTWMIDLDAYVELDALTETLCRAIADSDEFAAQYVGMFEMKNAVLLNSPVYENAVVPEKESYSFDYQAILDELRGQICFDFFQQPRIVDFDVDVNNTWLRLPVFTSQTKLIAALREIGYIDEERYDNREEVLVGLHFLDDGSTETVTVTGGVVDTIYDASADQGGYGDAFFLTRLDREYIFYEQEKYYSAINFIAGKVPETVRALFAH